MIRVTLFKERHGSNLTGLGVIDPKFISPVGRADCAENQQTTLAKKLN